MDTILFSIRANEEEQEILISELSGVGAEGFEQQEGILLAYFNEMNLNSYDINSILRSYAFDTSTIKEQNWNKIWERNFEPVQVDDFCIIRAEFHQQVNRAQHEIVITPKMSFGTGHHATTHLMIRQMRNIIFRGKTVLDFGTGTGILSILAEKLGAERIVAIDIDHWSKENALENIKRNSSNKIEVIQTSEIPQGFYDVVLANINRNVLLTYMPLLSKALKEKAFILMSGILTTDEAEIVQAGSSNGLTPIQQNSEDNWLSVLFSST